MNNIAKLRYGAASVDVEVDGTASIQDILDEGAENLLRLPESRTILLNGVVGSVNSIVRGGDVVTFERNAAAKAS